MTSHCALLADAAHVGLSGLGIGDAGNLLRQPIPRWPVGPWIDRGIDRCPKPEASLYDPPQLGSPYSPSCALQIVPRQIWRPRLLRNAALPSLCSPSEVASVVATPLLALTHCCTPPAGDVAACLAQVPRILCFVGYCLVQLGRNPGLRRWGLPTGHRKGAYDHPLAFPPCDPVQMSTQIQIA